MYEEKTYSESQRASRDRGVLMLNYHPVASLESS